jgi:hypothetical protein
VAAFTLLAINPFGGLLIAIPYAVLKLKLLAWLAVLVGIPLAFVPVLVVDFGWSVLSRWPWWHRTLEKRRSARLERLVASRGAFWMTVLLSPLIGPWLVMAFMRYAHVPLSRVALPLLLGLCWNAGAIGLGCVFLPRLFA